MPALLPLRRGRAPGQYLIEVRGEVEPPNPFKTAVVKPGQVRFVRIETLASWGFGRCGVMTDCQRAPFVVSIVTPQVGQQEMRGQRYIGG